ncbi:methyl-CpG-binding domain-containing protein 6-like [Salvia miltiorrhiza]|uniref:methyl-CpG-binding domain-containing protein 6-like n=1 Tax=Salvia miltiorrhiza TaxID=226208 RepID=UPI0025AB85EF|nr:methyl-CpG-binding domain-containing protein 6-like [Salvia miltiorrhiza]
MSEPQLPPDPVPESHDPEASPTDPLLDTGAYIDPGRNHSAAGAELPQHMPEFAPGVVIAAEPISMYVPGEDSAEATPRAVRRRDPEEMSKRPSWLPEDWKIDLKVRSSGATAGLIDRYYVEPTGQRRFRSKVEVLHFLETGSKPAKRKGASETETTPSGSPASQTQRKSNTKRKKSEAFVSDNTQPPYVLNSVQTDNAQQI